MPYKNVDHEIRVMRALCALCLSSTDPQAKYQFNTVANVLNSYSANKSPETEQEDFALGQAYNDRYIAHQLLLKKQRDEALRGG